MHLQQRSRPWENCPAPLDVAGGSSIRCCENGGGVLLRRRVAGAEAAELLGNRHVFHRAGGRSWSLAARKSLRCRKTSRILAYLCCCIVAPLCPRRSISSVNILRDIHHLDGLHLSLLRVVLVSFSPLHGIDLRLFQVEQHRAQCTCIELLRIQQSLQQYYCEI